MHTDDVFSLLDLGVDIDNVQRVFDLAVADSTWKKWKGTYRQVHTGVTKRGDPGKR